MKHDTPRDGYDNYLSFLGEAGRATTGTWQLSAHNSYGIAGVLQTEAHIRKLVRRVDSPTPVEDRLAEKLQMVRDVAAAFNSGTLRATLALPEGVLRRASTEDRLAIVGACESWPGALTVRAIPFSAGFYKGGATCFSLHTRHHGMTVASLDVVDKTCASPHGILLTDVRDVARFESLFAEICEVALDGRASLSLIRSM